MANTNVYSQYPDWSEAPEDATHFRGETEHTYAHWYKDGMFCNATYKGWTPIPPGSDMSGYQPRPVTLPNPKGDEK